MGSAIDTLLAVYTGGSLNSLVPVAANGDIDVSVGNVHSRVRFMARADTVYRIAVDGDAGEAGQARLSWNQDLPASDSYKFLPDGSFRLVFKGEIGRHYAIEASTDLWTWTRLAVLTSVTGVLVYVDMDAPLHPNRYYRTVRL